MHAESLKVYALRINSMGEVVGENHDDPGAEIVGRAHEYQHDHPDLDFAEVLEIIRKKFPALFREYGQSGADHRFAEQQGQLPASTGPNGADEKVHEKTLRHMKDTGEKNYVAAANHVLAADATLRHNYSGCVGN